MACSGDHPEKKLKLVKIKRKATDEQNPQLFLGENAKRFKFIGSALADDEDTIKELIAEKDEIEMDKVKSFEISDLADFIAKYREKAKQFPKAREGMFSFTIF